MQLKRPLLQSFYEFATRLETENHLMLSDRTAIKLAHAILLGLISSVTGEAAIADVSDLTAARFSSPLLASAFFASEPPEPELLAPVPLNPVPSEQVPSQPEPPEPERLEPEPLEPDPQELETPESESYLRSSTTCPEDIEILMAAMLRDLPGYANRVAYRSLAITEDLAGFGTILIAGRAEFVPLDITDLTFGATATGEDSEPPAMTDIQQAFLTTLERQYTATDYTLLEQYHWLFLTQAEDGWRLALMFSRLAIDEPSIRPPTPPRESSEGIIGQAVQLWLRDCRAGSIAPLESPAEGVLIE